MWSLKRPTYAIIAEAQLRIHRSPGENQPQKIVPDEPLRTRRRDRSGEHARSHFDTIALGTLTSIYSKFSYNRYRVKSCSTAVKWSIIFKHIVQFVYMCGCSHAREIWEKSIEAGKI